MRGRAGGYMGGRWHDRADGSAYGFVLENDPTVPSPLCMVELAYLLWDKSRGARANHAAESAQRLRRVRVEITGVKEQLLRIQSRTAHRSTLGMTDDSSFVGA